MATRATTSAASTIDVIEVQRGVVTFHIIGETPLIMNRMSEKAKQQLLLPRGRMNEAEKATTQKHDMPSEFADSAYTMADPSAPTHLGIPPKFFKLAMCKASLDLPGTKKTSLERLLWAASEEAPVYGTPKIFTAMVKQAGISGAPDARTRLILPEWAYQFTVSYIMPLVKPQTVSRLLAMAGMTIGVGDWRQEKGSADFGRFRIVSEDDPDYQRIVANGGREAQLAAMAAMEPYNEDTARLYEYFCEESAKRKLKGVA